MDKLKEYQVEEKIENIESIVASVVRDFSSIAQLCYKYMDNELVIFDKELPVISISREYSKDNFIVNFYCFVEVDLSSVQVMNLRTIYRDIEVLKYLNANNLELWFYHDQDLIMEYNLVADYHDIEILRSELLLLMSKLFFAKLRLKDLLNEIFSELESVLTN